MSEYQLFKNIIELSVSDNWEFARGEWILEGIEILTDKDEYETCLCGHYPIKEVCYLENKENHNKAIVGNCCVEKFLGEKQSKVFNALTKGKINREVISLSLKKGIVNENESKFLFDVWRKRVLSPKQNNWKEILLTRIQKGVKDGKFK